MNIDRIALVSSNRNDSITIFALGLEFTANIPTGTALQFAIDNFPNETITMLDLTKPNPQVLVVQNGENA